MSFLGEAVATYCEDMIEAAEAKVRTSRNVAEVRYYAARKEALRDVLDVLATHTAEKDTADGT